MPGNLLTFTHRAYLAQLELVEQFGRVHTTEDLLERLKVGAPTVHCVHHGSAQQRTQSHVQRTNLSNHGIDLSVLRLHERVAGDLADPPYVLRVRGP